MRLNSKILLWIIILGLVVIRLSTLIDDPQHLLIPDSDCPICQAYQSQVLLNSQAEVSLFSLVIQYFKEQIPLDLKSEPTFSIYTIRAPPYSV